MKKTLIVIDMQKDFVDGSLGTSEAVAILDNVKNKIEEYKKNGDEIIFTRDTHQEDYMSTNEGKHLPVVHCVEGTPGWEIYEGLYVDGADIINKPSFGLRNASVKLTVPREDPITIIDSGMVAPESAEKRSLKAVGTGIFVTIMRIPSSVAIRGMLNMSLRRRPFSSFPFPSFNRQTP